MVVLGTNLRSRHLTLQYLILKHILIQFPQPNNPKVPGPVYVYVAVKSLYSTLCYRSLAYLARKLKLDDFPWNWPASDSYEQITSSTSKDGNLLEDSTWFDI